MVQVILKPDEFIVKLDSEDVIKVISGGQEGVSLTLVNPHSEGCYDQNSFLVLKEVLRTMQKK